MADPNPLDQIDPLYRGALRRDVVKRLLTSIFQGELPAGTHLIAKRLADRLGVSATPIREALVELEQMGVVELLHNRGAVVKPFGQQQLSEIYQVRCILETAATRAACGHLDDSKLKGIRTEMKKLLADHQAGDRHWLDRSLALDRQFHELIADGCGNGRLAEEVRRYDTLAQTLREIVANRCCVPAETLADHLPIIDALLAERADAAATAMTDHLQNAGKFIAATMFEQKSA